MSLEFAAFAGILVFVDCVWLRIPSATAHRGGRRLKFLHYSYCSTLVVFQHAHTKWYIENLSVYGVSLHCIHGTYMLSCFSIAHTKPYIKKLSVQQGVSLHCIHVTCCARYTVRACNAECLGGQTVSTKYARVLQLSTSSSAYNTKRKNVQARRLLTTKKPTPECSRWYMLEGYQYGSGRFTIVVYYQ